MLLGMSAFAQSGWTNPSGNYQLETVVYAAVDCGNYELYNSDVLPEVAAFVNGELRAVVSEYTQVAVPAGEGRIYTIRVGGETSDDGQIISFKLYDPQSGLIYPLSGPEITWTGDNTAVYPSNYYTLTASPASTAKIYTVSEDVEVESPSLSMRVGDRVALDGYYVRFYSIDGKETTPDDVEGTWNIEGEYVEQVSNEDGIVYIRGLVETPDKDGDGTPDYDDASITYNVGNFSFNIPVQVLEEYIPVTSIAIEDYNYYWPGYGRLSLTDEYVIYNNGESTPTYPGVRILSSSNPDVVELVQNFLVFHGIGTSTIEVVAEDNPEQTATFDVNILSALTSMAPGYEEDIYEYIRNSTEEEEIDYPLPLFEWVVNEDGLPVIGEDINEEFTIVSDNPGIIRVETIEREDGSYQRLMAVKKGTANVTFTSVYDPTKSTTYTMVVKQSVNSVTITEIDGVEIGEGMDQMPEVEISAGKTITAKAVFDPADADYENFTMQFVNANWGEIEGAGQYVEVISSTVTDGVCTFQFRFNAVPQEDYYLQAVIDMDFLSGLVKLNVVQKVESIELSATEMTLWIGDESVELSIDVKIAPDNATNKRYTVVSSNDQVVSIEPDTNTETETSYRFYASGKGETTLTFTSESNPEAVATCVVTVKRRVNNIWVEKVPSELYNDGEVCNATLLYSPEDADIDIEALTYEIRTNGPSYPYNWSLMDIDLQDAADGTIPFDITPRSLCSNVSIVFSYDKSLVEEGSMEIIAAVAETSVCEKLTLGKEWNWVSLISGEYALKEMSEVLVEARSKSALVYNDPAWGLFGSLSTLGTNEAYKVKLTDDIESYDIYLPNYQTLSSDGSIADKVFVKGWNWVSYPYEYSYSIEQVLDASKFAEGDLVLAKTAISTLTNGKWEGTLETLNPNEGYMIYCNNADGFTLSMPGRFSLEQGYFAENGAARAAAIDRSVWNYDHSRFANTMAVIAKFDIDDCSSYTVGAFVGDECRGEGRFVNGKAYISVAGEMGEVVTFRLYDKWTGEFIDVTTELTFTDMAGTAKAPVMMGVIGGTTGIVDINSIDSNNVEAIYDAAGRSVSEMTEGVYILKVREGDRVVTKKVLK